MQLAATGGQETGQLFGKILFWACIASIGVPCSILNSGIRWRCPLDIDIIIIMAVNCLSSRALIEEKSSLHCHISIIYPTWLVKLPVMRCALVKSLGSDYECLKKKQWITLAFGLHFCCRVGQVSLVPRLPDLFNMHEKEGEPGIEHDVMKERRPTTIVFELVHQFQFIIHGSFKDPTTLASRLWHHIFRPCRRLKVWFAYAQFSHLATLDSLMWRYTLLAMKTSWRFHVEIDEKSVTC